MMCAKLLSAVTSGAMTRKCSETLCTYSFESMDSTRLRELIGEARTLASVVEHDEFNSDMILGIPPERPTLISLVEACERFAELREALAAAHKSCAGCASGSRNSVFEAARGVELKSSRPLHFKVLRLFLAIRVV